MSFNQIEALERRLLLSVTAQLSNKGVLDIKGDNGDNTIVVSVDVSGNILVNGGAVVVKKGPATTTNTQLISIDAKAGNDSITVQPGTGMPAADIAGGKGDDVISGGNNNDTIHGGAGNDVIDGNQGQDLILAGDGNDSVKWDPGDSNDVIDGQAGNDSFQFNGANVAEHLNLSASGSHLLLTRDIASITVDLNSFEAVNLAMLGGADEVTVGDVTGTGLSSFYVDLSASGGGSDGAADVVSLDGTAAADSITVNGSGSLASVTGLPELVLIVGVDSTDSLAVNSLAGDDRIDASQFGAGALGLTLTGGIGNDQLTGSTRDDKFIWNPGDGNDIDEGGSGFDTLAFNGTNAGEHFELSANGTRAALTRDVGNISMDLHSLEGIDINALGGADTIAVNSLAGTGVTQARISLGPDGQADNVIVNGTTGDDVIVVAGDSSAVGVTGLAAAVSILAPEAGDRLTVNSLGGDDIVDASSLPAVILLTENGGDGDDVLQGGAGDDVLVGGNGDDVLMGNAGNDSLDGGPGSNVLIQ